MTINSNSFLFGKFVTLNIVIRTFASLVIVFSFTGLNLDARAGEITQYFPVDADGSVSTNPESGWRLKWEVLERDTHSYGGSAVLEIQSVEFMKGYKDDGSEDWIKILNNLVLAEMYVPYNDGSTAFYDISGFNFDFIPAKLEQLPKVAFSAKVEDQFVISEVIDDGIRWIDNFDSYKVRRGQLLRLRANLAAANYTYSIIYSFADDGRLSVDVGGTAQNYKDWDGSPESLNSAAHVHMGAWRMEFDLGDPDANKFEIVERLIDPSNELPSVSMRPFNSNFEGGENWDAENYTMVKITNTTSENRHDQPRNVSYVMKTRQLGHLKASAAPVTQFDFWVSRLIPDDPTRLAMAPELKYVDLPGNIEVPESIKEKSVVLWHNSSLFHIPRGEDFGPKGYYSNDGAAINAYAGFDLVPVNLWHKTPFVDRDPP